MKYEVWIVEEREHADAWWKESFRANNEGHALFVAAEWTSNRGAAEYPKYRTRKVTVEI